MVPHSYLDFMITAAGAAGALIGLLFVAITLRAELVFGPAAPPRTKILGGGSFTSLVNAFSLSLLAIIPQLNIGHGMVPLSLFCLYNTWRLHKDARPIRAQYALMISAANYTYEFGAGLALSIRPHETWIVASVCYVIFASFVIALNRAWTLIQTETVPKS